MSNNFESWKMPALEFVVLEKFKLYAKQLIPAESLSGVITNAEIIKLFDNISKNFALSLQTTILKGETHEETETKKFTHTYLTRASFWDECKYQLTQVKWLPKFIRYEITYKSTTVTLEFSEIFPVRVTKVCPHHESRLEENQDHFRFLLPMQFDEIKIKKEDLNPNASTK